MNANRTAVAVALLAGAVIGSSLWISARTEPERPISADHDNSIDAVLEVSYPTAAESSQEVWTWPDEDSVPEYDHGEDTPSLPPLVSEPEESKPVREPLGQENKNVLFSLKLIGPEGKGIANATVMLGNWGGKTDANGTLQVEIPAESCILHIVADGYISHYEEMELAGETSWSMVVMLERSDKLRDLLDSVDLRPYRTDIPEFNRYLDKLMGELLTPGMDTYDQVKACYDYLIESFYYKHPRHTGSGYWACGYQALQEGFGTCYDYSAAFTAMMRYIGLDCYIVEGATSANGGGTTGHYWPIIRIGDDYYIFDPQVEDSIAERTRDKVVTYIRFCLKEPNAKYIYNLRSRARCIENFERYLKEHGSFLDR